MKTLHRIAIALLVAAIGGSLVGCNGADKVPPPKEPEQPSEPSATQLMMMDGHDNEKPLEEIGGVNITSSPPGMEVTVNGKAVGKTPVTVDDLGAGTHTVVYKDGKQEVTMTVDLSPGQYQTVHHSHSPDASDAHMGDK